MLQLPLLQATLRTRNQNGIAQIWDPIRRKWVSFSPEEHVRQALISYLISEMRYPASLMAIERGIALGHTMLRFDLVVYHRNTEAPWMLIECKSPEMPLTDAVLHQLLQYQGKLPACRYWLITNGAGSFCADASDPQRIKWLDALPPY